MMKKLKELIVKKLNRDLEKTVEKTERNGVPDNNPRKLKLRINPLKGLFLNTDKLICQVDMDTDFRVEVEDILVDGRYLLITYRFEHLLYP